MPASLVRRFFSPSRVSLSNLRVAIPPSPADVSRFESIIRTLGQGNGIYRTTYRRRFANLDPWVNRQLESRFSSRHPLAVADWAASDCLTSAEWAESLFALFPLAEICASDWALALREITVPGRGTFITEEEGHPLQFVSGRTILQLHPLESNLRPWRRWAAQRALQRFRSLWATLPAPVLDQPVYRDAVGLELLRLPLTHPEARTLQQNDHRFSIAKHSAFVPLEVPVDVLRSMNIFNNAYFPPDRLVEGARAVWHSLRTGGVWIVGRTVSETPLVHEVSVFERNESGFALAERNERGSEIEALVLSTAFPD